MSWLKDVVEEWQVHSEETRKQASKVEDEYDRVDSMVRRVLAEVADYLSGRTLFFFRKWSQENDERNHIWRVNLTGTRFAGEISVQLQRRKGGVDLERPYFTVHYSNAVTGKSLQTVDTSEAELTASIKKLLRPPR